MLCINAWICHGYTVYLYMLCRILILKADSHLFCFCRVVTGSVYKMIWTYAHIRDAGKELFSIPAS